LKIGRNIYKALKILCAIAMVWTSFAHRPVIASETEQTADLSAYTLPDGTVPVICISGENGEKNAYAKGCPYCTLVKAAALHISPELFTRVASNLKATAPSDNTTNLSKSIRFEGAPQTGPPSFST
jgi:hypothetical protein